MAPIRPPRARSERAGIRTSERVSVTESNSARSRPLHRSRAGLARTFWEESAATNAAPQAAHFSISSRYSAAHSGQYFTDSLSNTVPMQEQRHFQIGRAHV